MRSQRDGKLMGYNTYSFCDMSSIEESLMELQFSPSGKLLLMIGDRGDGKLLFPTRSIHKLEWFLEAQHQWRCIQIPFNVAFDAVYIPKHTKLLQQAEAIGALVLICVVFWKG